MGYVFLISVIICLTGWVLNIVALVTADDFASPYKAEVMRSIGIFVAPIGAVEGWMTFDEEKR